MLGTRKPNRDHFVAFAARLADGLGDNLSSIVMHGSAVRSGYAHGHTDLRVLLIVKDASTAALRPIEGAIAEWVKKREMPPLIFSDREWRGCTDVFPLEIEDMREAHELLEGADPFAVIETTDDDLRRELERELRGKLLQLRSEYAAMAPDGKLLTKLLLDSVGTFFVLMRGLVRLVGGAPKTDPAELIAQAAEAARLDAGAFDWVVRKITGMTVPALKAYDPVGARYVDEIERMADFVDQFEGAATGQNST